MHFTKRHFDIKQFENLARMTTGSKHEQSLTPTLIKFWQNNLELSDVHDRQSWDALRSVFAPACTFGVRTAEVSQ